MPRRVVLGVECFFLTRRTIGLKKKRKRRDALLQVYALPCGSNVVRCSGERALVCKSTYAVLMSVVRIERCRLQTFGRKQLVGCGHTASTEDFERHNVC